MRMSENSLVKKVVALLNDHRGWLAEVSGQCVVS